MLEEMGEYFRWAHEEAFKGIPHSYAETTEKDHGRIEVRRVWATEDLDWLPRRKDWKGLRSAELVESERIIGEKRSLEQQIYINSLPGNDAEGLGAIVRGHWTEVPFESSEIPHAVIGFGGNPDQGICPVGTEAWRFGGPFP